MKPRLLWVGDAAVATGFAKVTHNVLNNLMDVWEPYVLAINYFGDPHEYPYPIFPCRTPHHRDSYGTQRLPDIVKKTKPEAIVIQSDPWNIPRYMEKLQEIENEVPVIGVIPVDGKNCQGEELNDLDHVIFWTEFARDEAVLGGYTGPSSVIPLGVDLEIFKEKPVTMARRELKLPERLYRKFIVGNVNRNQPRKRLDLTISAFADWVNGDDVDDAYLMLHSCPTGDHGFGLNQLMKYHGLHDRLMLVEPDIVYGIPEASMVNVYNSFDVQISTTQGEGWGFTTMEGMACGVPQIVPNWSALGEWASPAAYMVECSDKIVTPNGVNVIGAVPGHEGMVNALRQVYQFNHVMKALAVRGKTLVTQDKFRWENISKEYSKVLQYVIERVVEQAV